MTSVRTLGAVALFLAAVTGCMRPPPRIETPAAPPASQAPPAEAASQIPTVPMVKLTDQPVPIDVAIPSSEYPREALLVSAEASVVLKILIDDTGRVREAKAIRDPGYGFGAAAERSAIAHFRFSPGRLQGRPVATWWTFTVTYELPPLRPRRSVQNAPVSGQSTQPLLPLSPVTIGRRLKGWAGRQAS